MVDEKKHLELTAVIKHDGDWWIGWIQEIPGANAQERTREEFERSGSRHS